jgi:mRNA interferase MazF
MVVAQRDVFWADLRPPRGSEPGFRRPVVVVQGNALNNSRISTIVCVPLTGNLKWEIAPGNLRLRARTTGLPKDSVANVSQLLTLDRTVLIDRIGRVRPEDLEQIFRGIDLIFARI